MVNKGKISGYRHKTFNYVAKGLSEKEKLKFIWFYEKVYKTGFTILLFITLFSLSKYFMGKIGFELMVIALLVGTNVGRVIDTKEKDGKFKM